MLAYENRINQLLPTVSVDDILLIETLICVEVEMVRVRTVVRALKSAEQSCACNKHERNHAFKNYNR